MVLSYLMKGSSGESVYQRVAVVATVVVCVEVLAL